VEFEYQDVWKIDNTSSYMHIKLICFLKMYFFICCAVLNRCCFWSAPLHELIYSCG